MWCHTKNKLAAEHIDLPSNKGHYPFCILLFRILWFIHLCFCAISNKIFKYWQIFWQSTHSILCIKLTEIMGTWASPQKDAKCWNSKFYRPTSEILLWNRDKLFRFLKCCVLLPNVVSGKEIFSMPQPFRINVSNL